MSFSGPKTDELFAWCSAHGGKLPRQFILKTVIVQRAFGECHNRKAKTTAEMTPEENLEIKNGKWLFRMIRAYRVLTGPWLKNIVKIPGYEKDKQYRMKMQTLGDMSEEIASRLDERIPDWRSKL